jgi:Restriction endonuclease
MHEINWGNFKAKFNGKEQKTFELLSYLLFCDEFDKRTGISRYKNQAGIETEPILVNDQWVGFQAKFYDTKISDNKADITDSIKKAKEKNPNLQRLLFYTNQEFSESRKKGQKEPKYKIDLEESARLQGIQIEWRVPSHFEAQLAFDKNRSKAKYFFSLDKGVINFIEELYWHTQSILEPISSRILFHGSEIKIDRSLTLRHLTTDLDASPLVILSGESGVGKTAVVKDFYDQVSDETPFFIFRGTEFNIHVDGLCK